MESYPLIEAARADLCRAYVNPLVFEMVVIVLICLLFAAGVHILDLRAERTRQYRDRVAQRLVDVVVGGAQ